MHVSVRRSLVLKFVAIAESNADQIDRVRMTMRHRVPLPFYRLNNIASAVKGER